MVRYNVFSFHPVKIITTFEGGMAVTNKKRLYQKLKLFLNHGITKNKKHFKFKKNKLWYYEQQLLGLNYRMTDVAASMGLSQLKKLNRYIKIRNQIARKYLKLLNSKYLYLPKINNKSLSTFHLYVVKLKSEYCIYHEKLFNYLRKIKLM